MKQLENYCKSNEMNAAHSVQKANHAKSEAKLADANSDEGLTNPSLMLWALMGLSAEHSYLMLPLS